MRGRLQQILQAIHDAVAPPLPDLSLHIDDAFKLVRAGVAVHAHVQHATETDTPLDLESLGRSFNGIFNPPPPSNESFDDEFFRGCCITPPKY